MKVLAIDPGETSAFVLADVNTRAALWVSTWHGMDELVQFVAGGLFDQPDVIVAEDYRVYPNRARTHIGASLYTVRELGRIEWLAFINNKEFVLQSASMAKQRWPDSEMRATTFQRAVEHATDVVSEHDRLITTMQSFHPTDFISLHIRDAFRHLLTWMSRNKLIESPLKVRL